MHVTAPRGVWKRIGPALWFVGEKPRAVDGARAATAGARS
jgi:hypothetical protein